MEEKKEVSVTKKEVKKTPTKKNTKKENKGVKSSSEKKLHTEKQSVEKVEVKSSILDEQTKPMTVESKKQTKSQIHANKLHKFEKMLCIIVAIIFVVLIFMSIKNANFIPATIIALALELFCICYYYIEDVNKKALVYSFFGIGVVLVIFEVIYLIIKTR